MTKIIRGTRLNDDWVFGKGKSDYLTGDDAIAFDIQTKLRTFKTECFFDQQLGVAWFDLLGQKDQNLLLLNIKSVILSVDGVMNVTNIVFNLDNVTRNFLVQWWVSTINSQGISGETIL
jgi:hypothetical protein